MPFSTIAVHLRGHRSTALLSVSAAMLEVYCDLQQPHLVSLLVDQAARARDIDRAANIGQAMVLYAVLGMVAGVLCAWFSNRASFGFAHNLRRALFVRVQGFEGPEIARLTTASMLTRLTSDTNLLQEVFSLALQVIVRAPILLIAGIFKALAIDLHLATALLGAAPLMAVVVFRVMPEAARRNGAVRVLLDATYRIVQECLQGIRVIRTHDREETMAERFRSHNRDFSEKSVHAASMMVLFQPLMFLITNLCVAVVLIWVGHAVVVERLTMGQAMAFVSYLSQILGSLVMLSILVMLFSRGRPSYERVSEVLLTESSITAARHPRTTPPSRGDLEFHDVGFAYGEGGHVLSALSFAVPPGTRLGIVGATGSGKSTLVSLILRLVDPLQGKITVDGVDVREYELRALRSAIGFVPQTSHLFAGTIRDNVELRGPLSSDVGVEGALSLAEATEFVATLPQGSDTVLDQRGAGLSGGQRQRLCIARAIASAPRLLILDDATSALDGRTEGRLFAALRKLGRQTTLIVISSRLGCLRQMDRILVLDRGRLVADGTHSALVEESSVYREIVRSHERAGAECPS